MGRGPVFGKLHVTSPCSITVNDLLVGLISALAFSFVELLNWEVDKRKVNISPTIIYG